MNRTTGLVRRVDGAGLALTVALCVAAVYFGTQPVAESKRRAASLRSDVRSASQEASLLMSRASVLTDRVSTLRRALEESTVPLKPSGSVNAQIARITGIAHAASLTIGEIAPGAETRLSTHIERPVHVSGSGAFPDVVGFLQSLQRGFPDLRVRSMRLHQDTKRPETVAFAFDLTWYADLSGG